MALLYGTLRDYHRDPFPHSLLRTRESSAGAKNLRVELPEKTPNVGSPGTSTVLQICAFFGALVSVEESVKGYPYR